MEKIKLTARVRSGSGKSYTRKTRSAGWIPAAYYGFGVEPMKIEVHAHEFSLIISTKQHNKLIELEGEGIPAGVIAVIRDVQRDAVVDRVFYHIDFQNVDSSRPVKARTFLKLVGDCESVRMGGILNQAVYEVEIEALVADLPAFVEADISGLSAGNSAMAADIILGDNVKLLTSPARVIARLLGKAKG